MERERSVLIPLYTAKESQRLQQYSLLLHTAQEHEKRLQNGERLMIQATCSQDPKTKPLNIFELTWRHPPIFREMAWHLYEGYFKGDPRLEATVKDIQKELKEERNVERAKEDYQLDTMWNS